MLSGMQDHREDGPSPEAIAEAARYQDGGWVYEIRPGYGPDDAVPPDAVRGAWKVAPGGKIEGSFVPNPNYRERP
jgi:hypothetical protein